MRRPVVGSLSPSLRSRPFASPDVEPYPVTHTPTDITNRTTARISTLQDTSASQTTLLRIDTSTHCARARTHTHIHVLSCNPNCASIKLSQHVSLCVCVYVSLCVCVSVSQSSTPPTCSSIQLCQRARALACVHMHACVSVCACARMHVCTMTYSSMCVRDDIHTHTVD
jgi:hypothetical protein